ncbi:hypothetical protein ASPFODRAFT_38843 [Aspergillus luchuensis CBS 106.47]|uniref:Uncharacterized protein n=1 Tax=Aspergillus luchuensis (strain CBS 106.47) TaxID=1137211 RepID=A0A1M3TY34_ASPLC|nr:hypothetical protein ASPFODRAFT_38843 [Aspergillus luchuensis CBS 106.47]
MWKEEERNFTGQNVHPERPESCRSSSTSQIVRCLFLSHFPPSVSPEIGDYFWDDASCADSRGPADPHPVGIFSPVGRTVP